MSFIDCLISKQDAKLLTEGQVESLLNKYEQLAKRYSKTMGDEQAAAQAAADIMEAEARTIADKKRNTIRAALAQKRITNELDATVKNTNVTYDRAVRDLYEKAYVRKNSIVKQWFANLDGFIDEFRSKAAGLYRDSEGVVPVVRELLGDTTGNVAARDYASSLRKTFDLAHQRFKNAGGLIGKLDNYFPQFHVRESINKVPFEEWQQFLRTRLDTDKMIDFDTGLPFTEEKLLKTMKGDYDAIVTNGRSELMKRAEEGKQTFGFGTDVSQRRMQSRFYHFKDADSFLQYNEKFGSGKDGLYDSIINSFEGMARDTALLETLGTKPNSLSRHLDLQMAARGVNPVKQSWTNGMFDVLTGRTDGTVGDSAWFSVLANTQNLLRSALLGSAPLSALSDTVFLQQAARMNGLSGAKVLGKYAKQLNPANKADRELAKRHGYIADIARGSALSDARFAGETMGGKATSWLSGFTNRASGLQAMTKGAADAASLELEANVAELVRKKTTWDSVPKEFRDAAEAHGFSKKDWEILSKAKPTEPEDGIAFMRGEDIMRVKGEEAEDLLRIASQLDDWTVSMRFLATNEPVLRTRALSTGAAFGEGRRGTVSRALFSSVFMLKGFPVTVMFNHVLPAFKSARRGKYEHLATMAIGTSLLGGLAIQAKDIVKGRDPREVDSKFWVASMLQGGGLGLFGDFLFSDYSRFGREPLIDALAGPIGGLSSDVLRTFMGNFDRAVDGEKDSNFTRDLFNLAKRNTPAVSLWYSRLVTERLLFDEIERMIDPKFNKRVRRMEKRFKKDFGQGFWWEKGDKTPDRLPKFN